MTTLTLGLDGGSFELLAPWLANGDLPTLAKLRDEGTSGDMQSCLPPVTCPNWQCYSTGTNPGKLGVFWWEAVDRDNHRIRNTSARTNFEGEPFWSYLEDPVAVVNLPTSYPPPQINGIHVAGGPGAEQTGYTYPASLETILCEEYNYAVHPEKLSLLSRSTPDNPCIQEIYDLVERRFDFVADQIRSEDYEFVHLTIFYLNMLQHFYWNHEVVKRLWQRIDERISDLLELPAVENVFVMSDHGSNEIETEFRINTWLQEHGYLYTKEGKATWLAELGITRERIRLLLGKLGIEWWIRRFIPRRVQDLLPDSEGRVKKSGKESVIDWERSTAIASGQGPVYVLTDSPKERRRIRDELIEALDGLNDEVGIPVVAAAQPSEEIYEGPYVGDGPDIVLEQEPNVHIDGSIGASETFGEPETWYGENKDTGMFIAFGDDIEGGKDIEGMHILDLAPTILHLHGQPIPDVLDGQVRTDVFATGSDVAERTVQQTTVQRAVRGSDRQETRPTAEERLQDLGYL